MLKRYSFRAYPNAGQQVMLARTFGSARVVFNDFLAERQRLKDADLHRTTPFSATARLVTTLAKQTPERAWLAEVSSVPLQQAVRQAERAYKNWFASLSGKRAGWKVGHPRFRRRHSRQTIEFTRSGFSRLRHTTHGVGYVYLARIGDIRFTLSRPLPSDPTSVTVILETDGTYHLSFVVDVPAREPRAPEHAGRAAGIDLGLTDFAAVVYSDGTREKIENPRHLRAAERKLARLQHSLSRKQKGSHNRAKARVRVARAHAKVRHQRLDHAHQTAARLIRENQAVTVETLSITGMVRTRLAKSVSDAGWGQFLRILEEKAGEHDRVLVKMPGGFPSTQLCAVCGVRGGKKPLHIRVWVCACGARLDRDFNAATNLLAGGHPESLNACGREVRLQLAGAHSGEAGTRRTVSPDKGRLRRNPLP